MKDNILKFTALVNVDGTCVQHQEYWVEQTRKTIRVRESGRFPEHPGVAAQCEFVTEPEGYHSIDVHLQHPKGSTAVHVHRKSESEVEIAMNGGDNIPISITNSDGIAYFDGPNPMFDYVNAILLMGIQDGEDRTIMMNVLQWTTGEIMQLPYTFSKNNGVISIRKDLGEIVEAKIFLDNDGGGMQRYRIAQEEYLFASAEGEHTEIVP